MRLFVDGPLELGVLSEDERAGIEARCAGNGRSVQEVLEQASSLLSGLSRCASMVVAPRSEQPLKHIEFVALGPGRALVVLVTQNGTVENRLIELPLGLSPSALVEAANYLAARLVGRTFEEAKEAIEAELASQRAQLDVLTQRVVEAGLATWAGGPGSSLIVRGQARLLEDVTALADLENIRRLFESLERGESCAPARPRRRRRGRADLHRRRQSAVRQYRLLGDRGALRGEREKIVGAIGVVGPTRMNYARIIPLVDYTAKVVGRLVG